MNLKFAINALQSQEDILLQQVSNEVANNDSFDKEQFSNSRWAARLHSIFDLITFHLEQKNTSSFAEEQKAPAGSPISELGKKIAMGHFQQDVDFESFFRTFKLVRKSFIDSILKLKVGEEEKQILFSFLHDFFDEFELGFSSEWMSYYQNAKGSESISESDADNIFHLPDQRGGKDKNLHLPQMPDAFRTLIDTIPDIIWTYDLSGDCFSFVGGAIERILGYPRNLVQGGSLDRIFDPETKERVQSNFDRLLEPGQEINHVRIEAPHLHRDGSIIHLEIDGTLVRDGQGRPVAINGISRDITERIRVEQKNLEQQKQFSYLFNTIRSCVAIYEPVDDGEDFVFVDLNPAGEKHSKAIRDEIVGKRVTEVFPGIRDLGLFDIFKQVHQTGETIHYPLRQYKDDRISEWVENTVYRIPNGQIVAVYEDTSQEHLALEALEQSELKFRTLVDQAPEALFLHGPDSRILDVNQAAMDRYGYSREELLGMKASDIDPDYVHREDSGKFWEQLKEQKQIRFEARHRRKDGSLIPVNISLSAVELAGGKEILALAEDISASKEAETALRNSLQTSADIVQTIPSGLFIYQFEAPDHLILVSANPEAEKLTGIRKEDWIGREFNEIWPEAKQQGITDKFLDAYRTGKVFETEDLFYEDQNLIGAFRIRAFRLPQKKLAVAFENITEKKLTEKALLESHLRQEAAISAGNVGLWDWLLATDKVHFSREWKQQLGYQEDEISNDLSEWQDRVHPDDLERTLKHIKKMIAKAAQNYRIEFRLRHKDGSYRWILAQASVILDENNNPVRVLGSHLDITDRKKMENELIQQNHLLDSLIDALPTPVFFKDKNGRYIGCNQAFEEATGKNKNEIIGETIFNVWPEKYGATYRDRDLELLEKPGKQSYEYKFIRPDGAERDVIFYKSTFNDETGQTAGIVGAILDITDRKDAEEILRQSEEKFRHISEFSHIGIGSYNPDGTIAHFNERACSTMGVELDDVIGKTFHDLYPKELADEYSSRFEKALHSETPLVFEDEVPLAEGPIWFLSTYTRMTDTNGDPSGVLIFSNEITEKKRAEEETKELYKAARSVLTFKSFKETARELFDTCCRLTGARSGYVALLSEDGQENEVLFLEAGGMPCTVDPSLPMPIRGLRSECYNLGRAVFENDFENSQWQKWMPPGHAELRNVLFAPLQIQGNTVGLIGIANKKGDFTDRDARIAETLGDLAAISLSRSRNLEELEKSETKARSYLENAPYGVFIADEKGQYVEVNRAACKITGYTEAELLGMGISDLLPETELERGLNHFRQVNESGFGSIECMFTHKQGSNRYWSVDAVKLSDTRFLGFVSDITEQIRKETKYRTIIETTMDGFWLIDEQGNFLNANSAACSMLGYSFDELKNLHISDIDTNESPEDTLKRIEEIKKSGQAHFETKHRRKEGTLFDVDVSCCYLPLPEVRFVAFLRDITEKKQVEKQRQELEEQLHQSQKMEAVGRLAGGVAHDFNNLLTCINGYAEMVLEQLNPDDPLLPDIIEIRDAGERASGLTKQLLAFSRKQVIAPKTIYPNEILKRSQKMLRRIIGEDIQLVFHSDPDLGTIHMDPGQIDQILVNLAVNARDAMPEGGRLTLKTQNVYLQDFSLIRNDEKQSISGDFVLLTIQDNGLGMSEDIQEKIFEPFFSTKPKDQGTGLGLSTVYGIVEQNDGIIHVNSTPSFGTTFLIYFPRVTSEQSPGSERFISEWPKGNETILLVEDEQSVRSLATKILKRQGYSILEACNGQEALEKYAAYDGEVHLLITDVIMPSMSGVELYNQFHKLVPEMKVLFISGYTSNELTPSGVLNNGFHFLQKPFQPLETTQKVRDVLDSPDLQKMSKPVSMDA